MAYARERIALTGAIIAGIAWVIISITVVLPRQHPAGIAPQVAQVRGAVVHVEKTGECQGSGCLLSPDGILFTARHVSDSRPGKYTVTLDDGRKYPVKYVVEDRENDVSLMKLDLPPGVTVPFAQLAREDDMRVGDMVFVMGSPQGKDNFNSVSLGIVAARGRNLDSTRPGGYGYGWSALFQSDATVSPGSSGGPLFNMRGEVVGVLVAGMCETINYSVPVIVFKDTIETVRGWFNLCRFQVVTPDMRGPQGERGPQGPPASDPNAREDK